MCFGIDVKEKIEPQSHFIFSRWLLVPLLLKTRYFLLQGVAKSFHLQVVSKNQTG